MHYMKLNNESFLKIQNGKKTIELRLKDKKRSLIKVGNLIEFTNLLDNNKLICKVIKLHSFLNFNELYKYLPLDKCGYTKEEILKANPNDMLNFYSKEKQDQYGVLGIELIVIGNKKMAFATLGCVLCSLLFI